MCTRCFFEGEDMNFGQFAALMGGRDRVVFFPDELPDNRPDENCLCGVDIQASAATNGFVAVRDDFMGDYDLVRKEGAE